MVICQKSLAQSPLFQIGLEIREASLPPQIRPLSIAEHDQSVL